MDKSTFVFHVTILQIKPIAGLIFSLVALALFASRPGGLFLRLRSCNYEQEGI